MSNEQIEQLLGVLDRAYDKKSWHGTNLRGSVRRVSVELAAWRPSAERHNIWEIVVHCAYWKYIVRRRLTGEPKGGFPLAGSDWIARPQSEGVDSEAWKADVSLLGEIHQSLRRVVAAMSPDELNQIPPGGGTLTAFDLIAGVAAHDLYHAGQIQLLKVMGKTHIKPGS